MDRYKIVLADDHLIIRQGLRKIIEGNPGLEVVGEAGDGLELLELLKTMVPQMIILDISMPNLRGIDVIGEIKKRYPDLKVLILSMHKEYFSRALSAGADGYLVKEDADRELFSAVDGIRKGSIYLSPRLREFVGERFYSSSRGVLTEPLSVRERQVLELIARGKSNKEIADTLFISVRTAESHRANILSKLNLKGTADLVKYAAQRGLV